MNQKTRYKIFGTTFGACGIVFKHVGNTVKVIRIYVPPKEGIIWDAVRKSFPDIVEGDNETIQKIVSRIQEYFKGKKIEFSLDLLDVSVCKAFQLDVLNIERTIPYGKTASYAWIGKQLKKDCYRRIGQALAKNPFPIIIPCHRTIKLTRELGGYQGGKSMKRKMLEMEGVRFDPDRKVAIEYFLNL